MSKRFVLLITVLCVLSIFVIRFIYTANQRGAVRQQANTYIQQLSIGMSREAVHKIMGEQFYVCGFHVTDADSPDLNGYDDYYVFGYISTDIMYVLMLAYDKDGFLTRIGTGDESWWLPDNCVP